MVFSNILVGVGEHVGGPYTYTIGMHQIGGETSNIFLELSPSKKGGNPLEVD